ncbi:MAG: hypothetical protein JSV01_06910 [Desulfobacterales bacterium]|nr:MAG: hypothetical protein JSV01_06910 [Desulfobacterales bacterium]
MSGLSYKYEFSRSFFGRLKEREEMIVDIILILVVMFLGGLLGLIVEFLIYLYPIYFALLLLIAAQLLTLLGRMIKLTVKK